MRSGWGGRAFVLVGLMGIACGGAKLRATQFRGPDGSREWWQVACKEDTALCWREAGEVCPRGYDVAATDSYSDYVTHASVSAAPGFAVASGRTEAVRNDELTIHCHGPSVAHAPVDEDCLQPKNLRVRSDCPEETTRRYLSDERHAE